MDNGNRLQLEYAAGCEAYNNHQDYDTEQSAAWSAGWLDAQEAWELRMEQSE